VTVNVLEIEALVLLAAINDVFPLPEVAAKPTATFVCDHAKVLPAGSEPKESITLSPGQ
jgi:hypothetical protein